MKYCIRIAEDRDHEVLLAIMKEHALYEEHELEYTSCHQQLKQMNTLPITIFVVDSSGELLGYMSVIKQFSSWDMDWYLYLDCLYLNKVARGQGIGQALMEALKQYAQENQLKQIQWQTPIDNLAAIGFYQSLNAKNKQKQRFCWAV